MERFLEAEMGNTSYCLQPPGREDRSDLRPLAIGDFLGVYSLFAAGTVLWDTAWEMKVSREGKVNTSVAMVGSGDK